MKLILFVLFCTICSVKSKIITQPKLIKAGDSITIECNEPSAKWTLRGNSIVTCKKCPSSCVVETSYKNRITAYCNKTASVLHFNKTIVDDTGTVKCKGESSSFQLFVGDTGEKFHSENLPFALNKQDYTLVCERDFSHDLTLYNEKREILANFLKDECENLSSAKKNFHVTCEKKKVKLLIKNVTLNEDGKLFGCQTGTQSLIFSLIVNVPVTSISINSPNESFIENKEATFVCTVEESKPKAHVQWIILYNNGSTKILNNSTLPVYPKPISNGIYLKTKSNLKLELNKYYEKIICNATIETLPWKSSEKKLNIKYAPPEKPVIKPSPEICAGKEINVTCHWSGGEPEAILELSCLSKKKKGRSFVSIRKLVTREMNEECICNGFHIVRNETTKENLDIRYPPNNVTIIQTLYREGDNASLICNAFGGNPDEYNYIWSPGNQKGKSISIPLSQKLNKKAFTCTAYHSCDGNNHEYSTRNLLVEYKPIINTKDKITVIEYEINKLNCLAEGNPQPTIQWKIQNNIFNSSLVQVSFTRNNASEVQCIATANGKSGILKNSTSITINVTYPPGINIDYNVTKLHHQGHITCKATANPNEITYKLVQKWGKKRKSTSKEIKIFPRVSYEDFGEWICMASNGIPKTNHFVKKSIEIKLPVQAHFKGVPNETAIVGSKKKIKICFYCYPKATEVKWYKEKEEISSDQISYIPAEDGLFPFTGNCSMLELDITENNIQFYYLHITNEVNTTTFKMVIDPIIPNNKTSYIIIPCVIVVLLFIIIGASVYWYKFRRSSKKKQSNNQLVDNNNPTNDSEMIENSLYGTPNNAVNLEDLYAKVNKPKIPKSQDKNANVEELYAKVNKPKIPKPQEKNANVEELYAKVNKPKIPKPQEKNANVEELYAKVNKPKIPKPQEKNENVEELYAKVNKPKIPKPQEKNANVEELYAKVNKPKIPKPQEKNANVEELYAKVNKPKIPKPQEKNANVEELYAKVNKPKIPKPQEKNDNSSLYANVGGKSQRNKAKKKFAKKPAVLDKAQTDGTLTDPTNSSQSGPENNCTEGVKQDPQSNDSKRLALCQKWQGLINLSSYYRAAPTEEIYENIEMIKNKPVDNGELMYADLEFLSDKNQNKPHPIKRNEEDETCYAEIDFTK